MRACASLPPGWQMGSSQVEWAFVSRSQNQDSDSQETAMGSSKPVNPEDVLTEIAELIPDPQPPRIRPDRDRPLKAFSAQDFMTRTFNDFDLARELASLFISHSPQVLSTLREALLRKDAKGLAETAQSLKGSISNIGAEEALVIATELEQWGHAGNLIEAEKTLQRLEMVVESIRKVLSSISGEAQPWRILIADDDPVSRRMLQATLMKWGHDPIVASEGTSALNILLGADAPKMAVLDWMMPGLHGVEVCREVRKRIKSGYIYVILLTGKDKTDDIIEGLDAGADDYMVKPFDPYELKARLREGFRFLDRLAGPSSDESDLTDPLTDILSREAILVLLKREIAKPLKNPVPVSAVLAEIDGFSMIKDDLGPAAANAAVKEIGSIARSIVRRRDFIGRYSESKILLLLPGCDGNQAEGLAKKLRSRLESSVIECNDVTVPVTACLGISTFVPSGTVALERVISATESALKNAKLKGPNQYAFETADSESALQEQAQEKAISKLDRELIIASRSGEVSRARQLIVSGANVNARDNKGNTALMEAAFFKYPEIIRLLLEKGADVTIHNNGGDTALSEAIRSGQTEVVELLLPRFSAADIKGDSALLYKVLLEASAYGKSEVVKFVKNYLFARGLIRAGKKATTN